MHQSDMQSPPARVERPRDELGNPALLDQWLAVKSAPRSSEGTHFLSKIQQKVCYCTRRACDSWSTLSTRRAEDWLLFKIYHVSPSLPPSPLLPLPLFHSIFQIIPPPTLLLPNFSRVSTQAAAAPGTVTLCTDFIGG